MDWNLKSPSWDLTQFGHEPNSDNNFIDESSSSMVDLKLGRVTNCSDESKGKLKELGFATKMAGSSPSGSSKRARGGGNNATAQMVSCLVDGCVSDLKNCREYHRRHKVCELHSKTPQVTIGGHRQRFCQQCSRFHSLEEFDEGKRSCRKRLDGHNRRRRKPQPEPTLPSNSYLSNYPGTRLFPFSPSNLMANPTWPRPIKTMEAACLYNNNSNNKGMNPFPLMQGENPMFITHNNASSQTGGSSTSSNHRMFTTRVPDSDCALSLLSSPPLLPPMQPLVPTQQRYNGIEHVDSMILAGNPNAHCHGFFHMDQNDDESCSHSDPPQTLPFYWD